jgi:GNAT superfamily N-acetyltransferase
LQSQRSANYCPFVNDGAQRIAFVPLASAGTVENPELRKRVAARSTGKYTRHFIAKENSVEVAFVSLDFLPTEDGLGIYELFIPANMRGRGVGGKLLFEIENMARQQGYWKVQLAARPMAGLSQPELAAWYAKHGYVSPPDSLTTVLEKSLKKV